MENPIQDIMKILYDEIIKIRNDNSEDLKNVWIEITKIQGEIDSLKSKTSKQMKFYTLVGSLLVLVFNVAIGWFLIFVKGVK